MLTPLLWPDCRYKPEGFRLVGQGIGIPNFKPLKATITKEKLSAM